MLVDNTSVHRIVDIFAGDCVSFLFLLFYLCFYNFPCVFTIFLVFLRFDSIDEVRPCPTRW